MGTFKTVLYFCGLEDEEQRTVKEELSEKLKAACYPERTPK
jgi:hypothetical protein